MKSDAELLAEQREKDREHEDADFIEVRQCKLDPSLIAHGFKV